MSTAAVACKHNDRLPISICSDIARWICAFPIASKNFLRPNLQCSLDGHSRRREIGPLLSGKDTDDILTPVNGGGSTDFIAPIHVIDRLRELVYMLSFDKNANELQTQRGVALYRQLNQQLDNLCGSWGAMERIAATPFPFVYVVHL